MCQKETERFCLHLEKASTRYKWFVYTEQNREEKIQIVYLRSGSYESSALKSFIQILLSLSRGFKCIKKFKSQSSNKKDLILVTSKDQSKTQWGLWPNPSWDTTQLPTTAGF